MQIAPATIERIKAATGLKALAGRYLTLRGDKVPCPFHQDRTPSCHIYADGFKCYACGESGDAIKFLMAVVGWTFPEAVGALAREAGISLSEQPANGKSHSICKPRERSSRPLTASRMPPEPLVPIPDTGRLNSFLQRAQVNLWGRPELQGEWLTKRNLTLEAVRQWGVGFLDGPVTWPVIGKGLAARNVWVIPVCDPRGTVRALKLHIEDEAFRAEQGTKSRWGCFGRAHPGNDNRRRHAYQTLWPPPEWFWSEQDERAAIMEFEGEMSRAEAERLSGWRRTCLHLLPGELKALRWIAAGEAATSITRGEGMKARDWTPGLIARLRAFRLVVVFDDDGPGRGFRDETVDALAGHIPDLRTFTHGSKE